MIRRTRRSLRVLATYGVVLVTASLSKACTPGDHATESLVGAPSRPREAKAPSELPAVSFRQIDFTLDDGEAQQLRMGQRRAQLRGRRRVSCTSISSSAAGGSW